jgi:hypothetical protein
MHFYGEGIPIFRKGEGCVISQLTNLIEIVATTGCSSTNPVTNAWTMF